MKRLDEVIAERDQARAELAKTVAVALRYEAKVAELIAQRDWLLEYGASWLQDREGFALADRQEDEIPACRAKILEEMAEALKAKGVAS